MPAISCAPNDLLAAAVCYKCIPVGEQNAVIIYLLNRLQATPLTIQQLLDGAVCYKCIPAGMQAEIQTYLLCQILMYSKVMDSGIAALAGGTATVSSASASASNPILLTYYAVNGNSATVSYGSVVSGTSFVISSSNGADTNLVSWAILKP